MMEDTRRYYETVLADFRGLQEQYPFSTITIPPTMEESMATIQVVAAHAELIKEHRARKEDFTGKYSKQLYIEVPFDYKITGCKVYGAGWLDLSKLRESDIHINDDCKLHEGIGYELCVGVPRSFEAMDNVILESVKTADNLLVGYKNIMLGNMNRLMVNSYSHGDLGQLEYLRDMRRRN